MIDINVCVFWLVKILLHGCEVGDHNDFMKASEDEISLEMTTPALQPQHKECPAWRLGLDVITDQSISQSTERGVFKNKGFTSGFSGRSWK